MFYNLLFTYSYGNPDNFFAETVVIEREKGISSSDISSLKDFVKNHLYEEYELTVKRNNIQIVGWSLITEKESL